MSDAAAPALPFDPRQGTLLGFELPADAFAAMTIDGEMADGEPPVAGANVADSVRRDEAQVAEKSFFDVEPVVQAKSPSTERPVAVPKSATAKRASGDAPLPSASAKSVTPEKAASPRKAAAPRPAVETGAASDSSEAAARAPIANAFSGLPVAVAAGSTASSAADDAARRSDLTAVSEPAEPTGLERTLASLQDALVQERRAAEERWRRTRHWLGLALACLALVLLVSVAQTVALVGFAHRAEAAQAQALTALNEQQAALATLASATSALSARTQTPVGQAPAADAAAPAPTSVAPPVKHAKSVHARRVKEREKDKAAAAR